VFAQEQNLWNTQKKLLECISAAGFPGEVVAYVQTWRVVAIGAHEYNYHLPRGLGKLRSMKAVLQRLRDLQEQDRLISGECCPAPLIIAYARRAMQHLLHIMFYRHLCRGKI
jgi:hypothetical protein